MSHPLNEMLASVDCGRILDIATGRGEFLLRLADACEGYTEAVGIDREERIVKAAREFMSEHDLARVSFQTMDAAALTFPDDSFDTVAISNSLHHLNDLPGALREMRRVLKPGGRLVCVEMYRDGQSPAQQMHVDFHHWWGDIDRVLGVPHNPTFTRAEILRALEDLSFADTAAADHYGDDSEKPTAADLESLAAMNDKVVERIRERPEYDALKARGEALKARLLTTGWALASQLVFVGRK